MGSIILDPQSNLPFLLFVTAILSLAVVFYSWQRRTAPGGYYFILLMLAVSVFAFTNGAEASAIEISAKITWSKLSYISVVSLSPLWLLFSAHYSQNTAWLTRPRIALLWVLPLITFGLAATNEWHGWIWPTITPISEELGSRLIYSHGVGVLVYAVYAYGLMLVGTFWLLKVTRRSPMVFRRQTAALTVAALIPWIGNLLYLLNVNPWPGVDLTPISFLITGTIISWTLNRYQMFNLAPIAREVLFESIGDGVIVLDTNNRIVDLNPTAHLWMGVGEEAIGQDIFDVTGINSTALQYKDGADTEAQLVIGEGSKRNTFDLTFSPLQNYQGLVQGRVVLLHNMNRELEMLDNEQRHARQMEMLNAITRVPLTSSNFQQILQSLANRVCDLFNADGTCLALWNEQQNLAIPTAMYGSFEDFYPSFQLLPGETTLIDSVLNSNHVLTADDVSNTPYLSPRIAALYSASSMMALPIVADHRKQGAILIAFNQPHQFSQDEIDLGEQAASQTAFALVMGQLYETEKNRNAQLMALQSVSQAIASSLELKKIFETVVAVLQNTFGYRYISIYYLEEGNLLLGTQFGYPDELIFKKISTSQGILGRAVRTLRPQFVRNVAEDPDFLRASYEVESEICVPLLKDRIVLGTLNIESTSSRPLTETDLNLLITFASQVVVAITNANLFKAEHNQREMADILRKVGVTLSENLDFETLLSYLLNEIKQIVPYDAACLLLVDERHQFAQVRQMAGYEQFGEETVRQMTSFSFEIQAVPRFHQMFETRQPLILDEKTENQGWIQLPQIHSWAGAPMIVQNQVVAFFSLEKIDSEYFREEHIHRLSAFCAQAAIALENARLYSEVQRLAILDDLTGLYNRRGLFEIGQRELERAFRFRRPLSLLFLDVDEFKLFNNTYSYAVGDQVLRQLAGCLKTHSREVDLTGRYGGDEFVVLLPESDQASSCKVAERLLKSIGEVRVNSGDHEVGFTVSIGVCQNNPNSTNLETLIDQAGKTLQEAKRLGRNRVACS